MHTQFDVMKNIFSVVEQCELKATTSMVLMYLVNCYNPQKPDIFPKQKTIAKHCNISESSAVRAINELKTKGLIIYQVVGILNHYKFTAKFFSIINLTPNKRQNERQLPSKLTDNNKKKEQIKNKPNFYIPEAPIYSKNHTEKILQSIEDNKINSVPPTIDFLRSKDEFRRKAYGKM